MLGPSICAKPRSVANVRLKSLLSEYGPIALGTYLAIFALVLTSFAVAISMGMEIESATGGVGLFGAAYVATKLTQPFRIAATLVLTPIVARVVRRIAPARRGSATARDPGDAA